MTRCWGGAGEPFTVTLAAIRSQPIPAGHEVGAYRAALDGLRDVLARNVGAAVSPLSVEVQVASSADVQVRPSPHLSTEAHRQRALLLVPGAAAEAPPEFRCTAAATAL